MSSRSHLLVPAVVALVVGVSVPAVADDAIDDPGQTPPAALAPSEEPTEELPSDPTQPTASAPTEKPAAEASQQPTAAPTTEPSASATPRSRPTQRQAETRLAAAGAITEVRTYWQLQQAVSTCAAGDVTRLAADVSVSGQVLVVSCDATLDLAGFDLNLEGLLVDGGSRATIDDSVGGGRLTSSSRHYRIAAMSPTAGSELTIAGGTITTTGAHSIAGLTVPANATLNITGGTVTATGGAMSAGIGGNGWADSGTTTISGGTVHATGGYQGAGIGGGYNRSQGPISITGGTVTAIGRGGQYSTTDEGGAGIGTGDDGYSRGPILIGEHAAVTATGGPLASAIGYGGDAFDYSADADAKVRVTINGTVRTNGILNTYNGVYTIGSTGQVLGLESDPQAGPVITGSGTIVNNGAIRPTSVASTAKVNNHHFTVSYDLASGTAGPGGAPRAKIYAPTLRAAGVTLPARPTRSGHVFDGWHRSATRISETTDLGTGSTNGSAVAIGLRAQWLTVSNYLTANLGSGCTPGSIVRLPEDITSAASVPVACTLTLDLNGHGLTAAGVTIASDKTLTVDDSQGDGTLTSTSTSEAGIGTSGAALVVDGGTIEATGGRRSAGIGGAEGGAPGTITINGGVVTATGGESGSGIGSGELGTPVDITITGGTVTSTGGAAASGIGGGGRSPAGDITISGGTVDATSGSNASAIGPGSFAGHAPGSSEGSLTVSGGAVTATGAGHSSGGTGGHLSRLAHIDITGGTLTASGTDENSGLGGSFTNSWPDVTIGAGATVTSIDGPAYAASASGTPSFPRGHLQVDGTLRLPSSALNVDRFASASIGSTGKVLGTVADPTAGGAIAGSRVALDNQGIIALSDVTASVTGHHYAVTAGSDTVKIYGPTMTAGHRSLPADPTRGIDVFTGWTHAGDPFTATTPLLGPSTNGAAVPVALTATWDEGIAAFDRSATTVTAGDPVAVDLTLTDGSGDTVTVDPADWDLTLPTGASLIPEGGGWELLGTRAGTATIVASTEVRGRTYTAELELTVQAAVLSQLVPTFTGTAAQGESVTLATDGTDRFGNDLGDVTGDVTFTSSIASDVIDGDQVSFTEAGTRIVTATHSNGTTATLAINVAVVLDEVVTLDLASTGTPAQGETITLTATGTDRFNNDLGDVTGDVTFTSSDPTDVIDGDEISFTKAGKRTITATHTNGTVATLLVDVAVVLGEVDGMEVGFTGAARQGDTIVLTVTGTDRFGNDLGDVTDDVTFTSSVPTDVIAGNRITFPHASPHTITATHTDGATSTLLIEVEPLPVAVDEPTDHADDPEATAKQAQDDAALAETGSTATAWWFACGLALLLAGVGTTRRARRR
ncbi:hypothetical protein GL325_12095 [Aeromicrobium sp. 636]|uniref:InlB B-repeat-containing protein n=1 Tax=Aeromicrobium senzhongii TaxID=2663859 RepID=A0A8I0EVN3_9ACTN|nr:MULTISPECIES: InlB B-repeat-containing protein [Aeromicrobium]MBC9227070.1 InlB B-repeat-containing protein [Aeromicrobium senzhongii]MCQ3999170.1 hypothetical protein [Aeromicrobium sp. 636]